MMLLFILALRSSVIQFNYALYWHLIYLINDNKRNGKSILIISTYINVVKLKSLAIMSIHIFILILKFLFQFSECQQELILIFNFYRKVILYFSLNLLYSITIFNFRYIIIILIFYIYFLFYLLFQNIFYFLRRITFLIFDFL